MELIKDTFVIKEIDMVQLNPGDSNSKINNKIFSKVSRIAANSRNNSLQILLDINTEIYPVYLNDILDIVLLNVSNFKYDVYPEMKDWVNFIGKDILDLYEYVIHGTIFHSGVEEEKFFIYASFGGLLFKLFGILKDSKIQNLKLDDKVMLLIRKL